MSMSKRGGCESNSKCDASSSGMFASPSRANDEQNALLSCINRVPTGDDILHQPPLAPAHNSFIHLDIDGQIHDNEIRQQTSSQPTATTAQLTELLRPHTPFFFFFFLLLLVKR